MKKGFVGFKPDPKVQAHGDGSGKHPVGWWVRKFKPSPGTFWERIRLLTERYS